MRPRGGILGVTVTPMQSSASGIWHLREAEAYLRAGTWPTFAGAPTSLTATAGSGSVALSWTAPSSVGGSSTVSYSIQYTPSGGSTTTVTSLGPSTSYTVTGLTAGVAHTFAVAAVTSLGTGPYSTTVTATPLSSFTPTAVLLTSGTSYAVPSGATSMRAWAVGGGATTSGGAAGGVAYKTWSVSGGNAVAYSIGAVSAGSNGSACTVTYGGVTISGNGGLSNTGGTFSGGDGGSQGGRGPNGAGGGIGCGNTVSTAAACSRGLAVDVSGLFAAVTLAGGKSTENCVATAPAFGVGGGDKYNSNYLPGYGGGTGRNSANRASGAVVLYFT